MKTTILRELIRESIQGYIREIDMVSEVAAIESKIAEAKNAIEERNNKLSKADELNESGLIDEKIVKKLQKEVALLEKYAAKQEALLEKKKAKMKGKSKEVDDDMITEEPMEEIDGLEEAMMETGGEFSDKVGETLEQMLNNMNVSPEFKQKAYQTLQDEEFTLEGDYSDSSKPDNGATAAAEYILSKVENEEADVDQLNESFIRMQKLAGSKLKARYITNYEDFDDADFEFYDDQGNTLSGYGELDDEWFTFETTGVHPPEMVNKLKSIFGKDVRVIGPGTGASTGEEGVYTISIETKAPNFLSKIEFEGGKSRYDEGKTLNESFLRMQKLAGVITEAQYNQKKNSLNKAPKTRIKLNENQGMVDYKDAKYYNEEGDYDDLQAYRDSPNEYPYDKVLSIFKDYEDERVVNDFKNTFKGKKFITRKEYGQFAEKYVDDASDGILIRANWISEDYPDIFDVMGLS